MAGEQNKMNQINRLIELSYAERSALSFAKKIQLRIKSIERDCSVRIGHLLKLGRKRAKRLKDTNFSIIANNCYAGFVYQYYGLPYASPTVGILMFPDEFLKLCGDLSYYLQFEPKEISYEQSKYKRYFELNKVTFPIGLIGDIEVCFVHYKTFGEAAEKWMRRAKRVNFDNIILKFSQMTLCTEDNLAEFDALPFEKKLCFVKEASYGIKSALYLKGFEQYVEIMSDTHYYLKYMEDFEHLINK